MEDPIDSYIKEIYFDKDTIDFTYEWAKDRYLLNKKNKIASIREVSKQNNYVWLNRKEVKKLHDIQEECSWVCVFRDGAIKWLPKTKLSIPRYVYLPNDILDDIYEQETSIALLKEDYDKHFGNATT